MPRRAVAVPVDSESTIQYSTKELFTALNGKMDAVLKELHDKTAVAETKLLEARLENLEKEAIAWKSLDKITERLQRVESSVASDETRKEILSQTKQTKAQWWGIVIAGLTALASIVIPFLRH